MFFITDYCGIEKKLLKLVENDISAEFTLEAKVADIINTEATLTIKGIMYGGYEPEVDIKEAKLECFNADIIAKASALLSIDARINELLKETWK